jgi:hypothetical protein
MTIISISFTAISRTSGRRSSKKMEETISIIYTGWDTNFPKNETS